MTKHRDLFLSNHSRFPDFRKHTSDRPMSSLHKHINGRKLPFFLSSSNTTWIASIDSFPEVQLRSNTEVQLIFGGLAVSMCIDMEDLGYVLSSCCWTLGFLEPPGHRECKACDGGRRKAPGNTMLPAVSVLYQHWAVNWKEINVDPEHNKQLTNCSACSQFPYILSDIHPSNKGLVWQHRQPVLKS